MALRDWPDELHVPAARDRLEVRYSNLTDTLPAEFLRVHTPSAERTGHGGDRIVIGGKRGVRIEAVDPVGRYAVRIRFSDGHATGLYTFEQLARLGQEREATWAHYLDEIDRAGLSRDEPGTAPAPGAAAIGP